MDIVSVKTENMSHIDRLGEARVFRVPVGEGNPLEQRAVFDRAVTRQLESERYDIVHVRGPFEGVIAAERKKRQGFRLVYEVATFPDEALGAEVEKLWAEVHHRCLEAADLVLVPTESARRAVAEVLPADRVAVLPPGVDVGTYDWRAPTAAKVPRLLYLGSFTADRDLATVLSAIKEVRAARPVRLLIAGEPDRERRARIKRLVDAFDLAGVVDVRGEPPASALPLVIGAATVCLAPALSGPRFQSLGDLPQPLLEYMACHRPVIAAGVPGVGEVLRDEQEGLLYPPGDEEALAASILDMLSNEKLAKRAQENAYRRVREQFSLGARSRRVTEIYEKLAPGTQGTDPWDDAFPDDDSDAEEIMPSDSDFARAQAAAERESTQESDISGLDDSFGGAGATEIPPPLTDLGDGDAIISFDRKHETDPNAPIPSEPTRPE